MNMADKMKKASPAIRVKLQKERTIKLAIMTRQTAVSRGTKGKPIIYRSE